MHGYQLFGILFIASPMVCSPAPVRSQDPSSRTPNATLHVTAPPGAVVTIGGKAAKDGRFVDSIRSGETHSHEIQVTLARDKVETRTVLLRAGWDVALTIGTRPSLS